MKLSIYKPVYCSRLTAENPIPARSNNMDLKASYKYLLTVAILSFASGFVANLNHNELRVGEASVRLPSFDGSKLDGNVRNLLLSAKSLASKYDEKLTSVEERIKLLKTNRGENRLLQKRILVKDAETLRRDISNDYSNIKRQFDAINGHPFLMKRNTMDASLMSRLNEFMQLLGKLPAQITCLIFDCALESGEAHANVTLESIPTEGDSYDLVDEN